MSNRIIAVDYEKCTGCRLCEIACALANTGEARPERARIRIVKVHEGGANISVPVLCMNCVKPVCKTVCPARAISDSPKTGARSIDKDKCIACSACVYACPFGAISVDREAGYAFVCSHCEGDPVCVRFCPSGAIQYTYSEEIGIQLRRAKMNRFLDVAGYSSSDAG